MPIEQTVKLSGLVNPFVYGLKATLYAAIGWLFVVVCVSLVFGLGCAGFAGGVAAIVALPIHFILNSSEAYKWARTNRTVSLSRNELSIAGGGVDWSGPPDSCVFFRGWTNDEPHGLLNKAVPAILVSWSPYTRQYSCVCCIEPENMDLWVRALRECGAIQQSDRVAHNALFDECCSLLPAAAASGGMLGVLWLLSQWLHVSDLHWLTGPVSSGGIVWLLSLEWLAQRRGEFVAHGIGSEWRLTFGRLILFGALGTARPDVAVGPGGILDCVIVGMVIVVVEATSVFRVFRWMADNDADRLAVLKGDTAVAGRGRF